MRRCFRLPVAFAALLGACGSSSTVETETASTTEVTEASTTISETTSDESSSDTGDGDGDSSDSSSGESSTSDESSTSESESESEGGDGDSAGEGDGDGDGDSTGDGDGPGDGDGDPDYSGLVINEVLFDGAVDGDPNDDGIFGDPVDDVFVEIVNTGPNAVDLDGVWIEEGDLLTPRHVFGALTLEVGQGIVVFGGGNSLPADTSDVYFQAANADTMALALDIAEDSVKLVAPDDSLIAAFAWGPATNYASITGESYSRDPDLTGEFIPHSTSPWAAGRSFSPGRRINGMEF